MTATTAEKVRFRLRVHLDLPSPEERRKLREAADMTQEELADAIGVTRQTVSNWEMGVRTPRGVVLDRAVDAYRALRDAMTPEAA